MVACPHKPCPFVIFCTSSPIVHFSINRCFTCGRQEMSIMSFDTTFCIRRVTYGKSEKAPFYGLEPGSCEKIIMCNDQCDSCSNIFSSVPKMTFNLVLSDNSGGE